jgi:hypothetical protein
MRDNTGAVHGTLTSMVLYMLEKELVLLSAW